MRNQALQENFPSWVQSNVHFSDVEHRVWQRRRLGNAGGVPVAFILHNPTAADEGSAEAHTALTFARAWGASDLILLGAATGIARNADGLTYMDDPIGDMADEALEAGARYCITHGGFVVASWGAPRGFSAARQIMRERFDAVLALDLPLWCFGLTEHGDPVNLHCVPTTRKPHRWNYEATPTHQRERDAVTLPAMV